MPPTVGLICLLSRHVTVPLLRKGYRLYLAASCKRNFIGIETLLTVLSKRVFARENVSSYTTCCMFFPCLLYKQKRRYFFAFLRRAKVSAKREWSATHGRQGDGERCRKTEFPRLPPSPISCASRPLRATLARKTRKNNACSGGYISPIYLYPL